MPNTPVPAAATGLPAAIPTRRAALAALAGAGAALSLPKAARAADPQADHIRQLTADFTASHADLQRACAAMDQAERSLPPCPMPDVLWRRTSDGMCFWGFMGKQDHQGRWYYGEPESIAYMRELEPETDQVRTRRDEIVLAYDRWQTDIAGREAAAGIPELRQAQEVANARDRAVRFKIIELRSIDPAAIALKLQVLRVDFGDLAELFEEQVADAIEQQRGPWEEATMLSIVRDIAAAQAGTPS